MSKNVEVEVFLIDELSEKAKLRAFYDWEAPCIESREIYYYIEQLCNNMNIDFKIDFSYNIPYFKSWEFNYYGDPEYKKEYLEGKRAYAYIVNNILNDSLVNDGDYGYVVHNTFNDFCYDLKKNKSLTLGDFIDRLLEKFARLYSDTQEYETSFEYFRDDCNCAEWYFYKNGDFYGCL